MGNKQYIFIELNLLLYQLLLLFLLFIFSEKLRPDLNGALFALLEYLLIKQIFEGKKAGVEGGNWRPNNY